MSAYCETSTESLELLRPLDMADEPVVIPAPVSGIKPPPHLAMDSKIREEWRRWRRQWDDYCIVQGVQSRPLAFQASLFRISIGPDAVKVLDTQPTPLAPDGTERDRDHVNTLISMMDTYVLGQVNPTYERHLFRERKQCPGESIDAFLTDIRIRIQTCEFPAAFEDEMLKDQMVHGVQDQALKERLLQEPNLTLAKCVSMCKAAEAASTHLKGMNQQSSTAKPTAEADIASIQQSQPRKNSKGYHHPGKRQSHRECKFCGLRHPMLKSKCPAVGQKCSACGELNHYAKRCPKSSTTTKRQHRKVHNVSHHDCYTSSSDAESIGMINAIDSDTRELQVKLHVQGRPVTFLLDTGASSSLLPESSIDVTQLHLGPPKVLQMWNGSTETSVGTAKLKVVNPRKKTKCSVTFDVVKGKHKPVLGLGDILKMNLIDINFDNFERVLKVTTKPMAKKDYLDKYPEVFADTLGTLEGEAHLTVDSAVPPVVLPARNVPLALRSKVKKELKRLLGLGVISRVDEPTSWVSQLVVVEKKNTDQVRLCIDPRPLNKALRREHHHLSTFEEIVPELSGAQIFAKCDLRNGYWHIPLDDESRKLTCFQSTDGRYVWNRLPFGLKVSSEIFSKRVHSALVDLPGTFCIADDVIVIGTGSDLQEATESLNTRLDNLLQRCSKKGIVLNPNKFEHAVTSVPFMGHLLTSTGVKPDPAKVDAIVNMPTPTDVAAVRRFCGTVTYLAKFLPNLSAEMKPLTSLTSKDAVWTWGLEQDKAFTVVKKLISTAPLLQHYQPEKNLLIQCDASKNGLGACLLQDNKPVCYASRTLTSAEENYAQIEKEALAIVFATERFHQYTYGRHTEVHTDHKPLEAIMCKPLVKAPLRLQRMLLRLQRYDLSVNWKPGKEMTIADTLSRATLPPTDTRHARISSLNAIERVDLQPVEITTLRDATANDEVLQQLLSVVRTGWPDEKAAVPETLLPFWSVRDEISHDKGLLFRGQRIIIPATCRREIRDSLHESAHQGVDSCLRRARDTVFWPGMNAELKSYIKTCALCAQFHPAQQPEPMLKPERATRPWEIVSVDLFTLCGKDYMVTCDHYSGFFEIDLMTSTTSNFLIKKLKAHFSRWGIPVKFISDNAPQLVSEEFRRFSDKWRFTHVTSSPYYAKGNGTAEAMVKIAKTLLKKATASKSDAYAALLAYRNTPKPDVGLSPAQLLLQRRARTFVPVSEKKLRPKVIKPDPRKLQKRERRIRRNYDTHAKALSSLEVGDNVRVKPVQQNDRTWKKATVSNKLNNRSYEICTEDGFTTRRNRVHLRPDNSSKTENAENIVKVETDASHMRTRSGRVVKPVKRLGFDD